MRMTCLLVLLLASACPGSSPRPATHDGSVAGEMGGADLPHLPPGKGPDAGPPQADGALLPDSAPLPDGAPPKSVKRLAGPNRVATAAAVSQQGWSSAAAVVVVSGKDSSFPDGMVSPPLAAKHSAPVLLTNGAGSCAGGDALLTEIKRLGASKALVLGGTAAVSASCFGTIQGAVSVAQRIAGPDRYTTAAMVASLVGPPASGSATLVTGANFPDGIAAGAGSASAGMPILLGTADAIPGPTANAFATLGISSTLVVGGTDVIFAVGAPAPTRIAGATRCETAVAAANHGLAQQGLSPKNMVLASGTSFADGVTAAGLAARLQAPLLLTASASTLCNDARALVSQYKPMLQTIYIVGGTAAVATSVEQELKGLL